MNILIVDDTPSKCEVLSKFLKENDVPAEKIITVHSARQARELVRDRPYDLLLIDLVLPASNRGEPRADVGFELLQEFAEEGRATRIIGTTANLEAQDQYSSAFRQMAEQLLLIDGINNDWRDSLKNVVQQIRGREGRPIQYNLDFAFLTAVRKTEYNAVLDLPIDWGPEKVLPNGGLYREGSVDIDGVRRTGLVTHAKQMGMVAACHLAQSVINEFRPRLVLMTGICGGLPGETSLGDLVIADKSWDWQSGKYASGGEFHAAPDQKDASPQLVAMAKSLEPQVNDIVRSFVGRGFAMPMTTPKFVDGPMLSGSSVVADDGVHELFLVQHRKPVAVDMEAYGVYYACRMAGTPAPDFLCLKAVSDQSNAHKADDLQPFCSALSAHVGWRLLQRHFAGRYYE